VLQMDHLRCKTPERVRNEIWTHLLGYNLLRVVKKELKLDRSLYEILQVLSVSLFEKAPVFEVLTSPNHTTNEPIRSNQLTLFDL